MNCGDSAPGFSPARPHSARTSCTSSGVTHLVSTPGAPHQATRSTDAYLTQQPAPGKALQSHGNVCSTQATALGARWQVKHGDLQAGLGGEPGQLGLPQPQPAAVGPAGAG